MEPQGSETQFHFLRGGYFLSVDQIVNSIGLCSGSMILFFRYLLDIYRYYSTIKQGFYFGYSILS